MAAMLRATLMAMAVATTACASSSQAQSPLPAPTPTTGEVVPERPAKHVVQAGETMWRIARRYGLTPQELAAKNGIGDVTKVRVGTVLVVGGEVLSSTSTSTSASKSTVAPTSPAAKPSSTSSRVTAARYPLRWPVEGELTSRYGRREGRGHDGIDIGAPEGTAVKAAAAGEVLFSARHGGYGNLVIVKHDAGLVTVYAHHQKNLVEKGQRVAAGQVIARVGTSGRASGPHLHFEVRRGTSPENPLRYLPP